MSVGISFTLISFFYILMLTIVFFAKKRLSSLENKIYSYLIITNLFGTIIGVFCFYFVKNYTQYPLANAIFSKLYLVYLIIWLSLFTAYVFSIWSKNKKILNIFEGIALIFSFLACILPLYYKSENSVVYSYGPSATLVYALSGLYILLIIYSLCKNLKNIKKKKYVPIFMFIILGTIVMIIQKLNPGLLLITSMETFITFLMFFTIENPDIGLINELNISKEAAERANQAKTEFLSNMSHEIRTPLNAIVGFSQNLMDDELSSDKKDQVKDIIIASENLLELVNGILDISKIEANKLEIIESEYYPKAMFKELESLSKARIGDRVLDFETYFDPTIPSVLYGDHNRLKQVILNLLTNAIKYTKEGKVIFKINAFKKDNICRLIISVEDTGIGIKQENIDKIFTKFERLGVEKEITIEGTGLGLAITKKLVDLMQGKILVQSTYGEGSKFTVSVDQKIVKEEAVVLEEKKEIAEELHFENKKVLVVDDNSMNLKVASLLLKKYNIEVETLDSGFALLEKMKSHPYYDLILLDDMMPKMSGVETYQILRQDEFRIPTIILTANAISGMKEKYLEQGFSDYLAKPIDKKELERILIKFLK